MDLEPETIRLIRNGDKIQVSMNGDQKNVERIVRAFPESNPDIYIGLMDANGKEIGMIEDPRRLDAESKSLLDAELKEIYYVPNILEIASVVPDPPGSVWEVITEDGEETFRIRDRDALDGSEAPAILVTDDTGKRYRIEDYWALDRESRRDLRHLIPDKVLQVRYGRAGRGRR